MLAKWFLGSGTRKSGMACVSISWSETQMVLFSRRLAPASEKAMAAHSSVLAWRIPGTGAWWAAVCGAAQSQTRLKRLSSSSSPSLASSSMYFVCSCNHTYRCRFIFESNYAGLNLVYLLIPVVVESCWQQKREALSYKHFWSLC